MNWICGGINADTAIEPLKYTRTVFRVNMGQTDFA